MPLIRAVGVEKRGELLFWILNFMIMLNLKDFRESSIEFKSLNCLLGGKKGDDTCGNLPAFGKSKVSECDIDNGNGTYDHYYGDEGWVRFYEPGSCDTK